MAHRENVHRSLMRLGPERLPVDVWVTEPALDMIEAHTGSRDQVRALDLALDGVGVPYPEDPEAWREAYASLGYAVPDGALIGFAGLTTLAPPRETLGAAYHLTEMLHPLGAVDHPAQLESLPWPDVTGPELFADLPSKVSAIHAEGRAAVGQMACTVFERAWYLRGMEALILDLIEGNGIADWLLDWFTEMSLPAVRAYCRAGADVILLGDDAGFQHWMLMAPDFWRTHLRPRLARVVRAIREAESERVWVAYHSDGDVRAILDDLAEIGIDVLNPVQPECMPLDEVIGGYRDRLAFWGTVGIQTTLPFGTPDDVRQTVRRARAWARDGAGIILAPTHVIEPDVPWANLAALLGEAARPCAED
jgi:uroporphyrinogen decarboxylase